MKAPYFSFYVRDWLCSRNVFSMTGDEIKAYIYLLSESWLQTPRATLPKDDTELASMSRLSNADWMRVKQRVLTMFKEGQCDEHLGRLFNDRLLEVSRNFEKNQRPNNKNARRTRLKRESNTKNRISSSSSSSSSNTKQNTKDFSFSFIEFWNRYPRKEGKIKAWKNWRYEWEVDGTLEKIKTALAWQIETDQWKKDSGQYIPHPSTYLNNHRWEDVKPNKNETPKIQDAFPHY